MAPAGNGCASVTRWRCGTPKRLPEFLNVVELEIHHHIQSSLRGRGGEKERVEKGKTRGGEQNIQSWTMATRHTTKFLQAGGPAASCSPWALPLRQWASLNTAPCTLIIWRILKLFMCVSLTVFQIFRTFRKLGAYRDEFTHFPTFSDLHQIFRLNLSCLQVWMFLTATSCIKGNDNRRWSTLKSVKTLTPLFQSKAPSVRAAETTWEWSENTGVNLHSVVQKPSIHSMPGDSLLSRSGRTCTCCWILLHGSAGFNHMICFCFLSGHRHGNRVYGCPQQQVKHRTPKQKREFPVSFKKKKKCCIFTRTLFFNQTRLKRENNTCAVTCTQTAETPLWVLAPNVCHNLTPEYFLPSLKIK